MDIPLLLKLADTGSMSQGRSRSSAARPRTLRTTASMHAQIQAYLRAAVAFTARTPILVVACDNDISTAGQNWFPLVGKIPNAQLLVYPESGHGPQHQYPELTAQYITRFLAMTTR